VTEGGGLHLVRREGGAGSGASQSSTELLRSEEDKDRNGKLGWVSSGSGWTTAGLTGPNGWFPCFFNFSFSFPFSISSFEISI
jgi:hypothetical protein